MSNQVYQIYHIIKCARFSKTYLPHTHIYGLLVYVSRTSFVNVGIRLVLFTPESLQPKKRKKINTYLSNGYLGMQSEMKWISSGKKYARN